VFGWLWRLAPGRPELRRRLADLQATADAAERGRLASNEAGLGSCGIVSL